MTTIPAVNFTYKTDISHAEANHPLEDVQAVRDGCRNRPNWFNPLTRRALRWCQLPDGRIGFQIFRKVENTWQEVTAFVDEFSTGDVVRQIEEYLVRRGYIDLGWLP